MKLKTAHTCFFDDGNRIVGRYFEHCRRIVKCTCGGHVSTFGRGRLRSCGHIHSYEWSSLLDPGQYAEPRRAGLKRFRWVNGVHASFEGAMRAGADEAEKKAERFVADYFGDDLERADRAAAACLAY